MLTSSAARHSEANRNIAPSLKVLEGGKSPKFQSGRLSKWDARIRRMMDILLSVAAIVMLSPLLLLIAATIRLESKGPIFFSQLRGGLYGKPFKLLKFRSMTFDPHDNTRDMKQAAPNDPRLTRIGKFLRKTSLDELPQLFNVLRGDMSLIGARPHTIAHDQYYSRHVIRYTERMRMKPGITGYAQVSGLRGPTPAIKDMQKRVDADNYYIDNWSWKLDISIVFRTIKAVLHAANAH